MTDQEAIEHEKQMDALRAEFQVEKTEIKTDLQKSIEDFQKWWNREKVNIVKKWEAMDGEAQKEHMLAREELSFRAWEAHRKSQK